MIYKPTKRKHLTFIVLIVGVMKGNNFFFICKATHSHQGVIALDSHTWL